MLDNHYNLTQVLAAYPAECQPHTVALLANASGFSGSRIWGLETNRGPLCLRRWPIEYPDAAQLHQIHRVICSVAAAGFPAVSVPIRAKSGETFIQHAEHLWELAPWLPGEADIGNPATSQPRIEAALAALAEFHRAVGLDSNNRLPPAAAPGILKRVAQLNALESSGLDQLTHLVVSERHVWPELADRGLRMIKVFRLAAPKVAESLGQAVKFEVPIQPCICDIHREHVLFAGDRVMGIIDFGAMQPDNPACDVARLLGSMAGDRPELWQAGLEAFACIRVLSNAERLLVRAYDESSVLLSGINWLRWVFVEGRKFENQAAVLARFDVIAARLRHLSSRKTVIAV